MSFDVHNVIWLHDQKWFEQQKIAGACVAKCLNRAKEMIQSKDSVNLLDLEIECAKIIEEMKCIPTFYQYQGSNSSPFPGKICLSVNKELVHGVPHDYLLQDGDVVKVDLGATFGDAIADAAITVIRGTAKSKKHIELLDTCKRALDKAISVIEVGKQVGVIGNAIHHTVKSSGFGLITEYGGHGIAGVIDGEQKPHGAPFIYNKSQANQGVRIQEGMSFAIEPLLCVGEPKTKVMSDGWTVACPDICAHFEHTLFISKSGVEVMTHI